MSSGNTRYGGGYVVRYHYDHPNPRGRARTTWDFNTKDKRQAYRKARKYAATGMLIGLFEKTSSGGLKQLNVEGAER